jgi:hypothetical protein
MKAYDYRRAGWVRRLVIRYQLRRPLWRGGTRQVILPGYERTDATEARVVSELLRSNSIDAVVVPSVESEGDLAVQIWARDLMQAESLLGTDAKSTT